MGRALRELSGFRVDDPISRGPRRTSADGFGAPWAHQVGSAWLRLASDDVRAVMAILASPAVLHHSYCLGLTLNSSDTTAILMACR